MFGQRLMEQLIQAGRAAVTPMLLKMAHSGAHTQTRTRTELVRMLSQLAPATATDRATESGKLLVLLSPILQDVLAAASDSSCDDFARVVVDIGDRLRPALER